MTYNVFGGGTLNLAQFNSIQLFMYGLLLANENSLGVCICQFHSRDTAN